jgi:hypothetical protein
LPGYRQFDGDPDSVAVAEACLRTGGGSVLQAVAKFANAVANTWQDQVHNQYETSRRAVVVEHLFDT